MAHPRVGRLGAVPATSYAPKRKVNQDSYVELMKLAEIAKSGENLGGTLPDINRDWLFAFFVVQRGRIHPPQEMFY